LVWHSSHTSVWLGRDIRVLNPPTGQDDEQLHVEAISSRDSTAVDPREAATTAFDARALRLLARISTYRVPGWDIGQRYGHAANCRFYGAPGEIRTPDPLLRRLHRVCMQVTDNKSKNLLALSDISQS
jgi:hypothetical protein